MTAKMYTEKELLDIVARAVKIAKANGKGGATLTRGVKGTLVFHHPDIRRFGLSLYKAEWKIVLGHIEEIKEALDGRDAELV